MSKVVAVIGASNDRQTLGNRAVRADLRAGDTVVPINPREREAEGLAACASVARTQVPEVWLNPGADSGALVAKARSLSLKPIVACNIVALGENPYAR